MTIAAKVSSTEVDAQVRSRFQDQYFEARLINAPGTTYTPGTTDDATFLGFEVTAGTAGYEKQVIYYQVGDILAYADGGVGLAQKATVFPHDGSGTTLEFTHVALCWSTGNVTALTAPAGAPTAMTDGTYTNIPIDLTDGSGEGMTVDLTVTNGGVAPSDYALTIVKPGVGYAATDSLQINNGTLAGLDAGTGTGDLTFTVDTVYAPTTATAGDVVAVAKTTNAVALTGGNEAVFYWNLKHFGFYSVI